MFDADQSWWHSSLCCVANGPVSPALLSESRASHCHAVVHWVTVQQLTHDPLHRVRPFNFFFLDGIGLFTASRLSSAGATVLVHGR